MNKTKELCSDKKLILGIISDKSKSDLEKAEEIYKLRNIRNLLVDRVPAIVCAIAIVILFLFYKK